MGGTGHLLLELLNPLTNYSLIHLSSPRLSIMLITLVSPSVVLLDNHTTNRIEKLAESYGWKWENPPTIWWESYHANYLKLDGYDVRMQPFYFLYGGYIYPGSLYLAGALGHYWFSTTYANNLAYYLHFNSANVYPSGRSWRYHGFSIRCLAR